MCVLTPGRGPAAYCTGTRMHVHTHARTHTHVHARMRTCTQACTIQTQEAVQTTRWMHTHLPRSRGRAPSFGLPPHFCLTQGLLGSEQSHPAMTISRPEVSTSRNLLGPKQVRRRERPGPPRVWSLTPKRLLGSWFSSLQGGQRLSQPLLGMDRHSHDSRERLAHVHCTDGKAEAQ